MKSSAKSDGGKDKGLAAPQSAQAAQAAAAAENGRELVRASAYNPFAFMREVFERFDFATPLVDIEHDGDQLAINIDLPGINPDDIEVTMDEYVLTLEGERHESRQRGEGDLMRRERTFGKFQRVLPLPQHVDPETAQASFENGVLEVKVRTIGTRPEGRRIPIHVVGREPSPTTH